MQNDAIANGGPACKMTFSLAFMCLSRGMIRYLKLGLCIFFCLFFVSAGIMHFVADDKFAAIVPPMLPFPYFIVWVTGGMEIAMGVLLLCPHLRARVGVMLGLFLLAVLPANIYMAIAGIPFGDTVASPAALWIRVALQFPLIAIIYWATRPAKV